MNIPEALKGLLPFEAESHGPDEEDPKSKNMPNGVFIKQYKEELEELLPELVGEDNVIALKRLSKAANVRILGYLRQILYQGIQEGTFTFDTGDKPGASDKRTKADEDNKSTINKKLRAVLGSPVYGFVVFTAKGLNVKNQVALEKGLANVIDTPKVLKDIEVCAAAQAEVQRMKDSRHALNTILGEG